MKFRSMIAQSMYNKSYRTSAYKELQCQPACVNPRIWLNDILKGDLGCCNYHPSTDY